MEMIKPFSRLDNSPFSRWWWTVDRYGLVIIFTLMLLGFMLSFSASPAIAEKIGLSSFYFVKRHALMLIPCVFVMISVSMLSPIGVRRLGLCLFFISIALLITTFFWGQSIKGAQRWINIFGFSLQPSEFIKPSLTVITAWLLSEKMLDPDFSGLSLSAVFVGLACFLLLLQPDLGMTIVILTSWFTQLFIAGMPLLWVFGLIICGCTSLIFSYMFFPHVAKRIDQFLDPSTTGNFQELYQIKKSLAAFANGGFFGTGPGEGTVKKHVPDAHADFVFAVAGEEFGFWLCMIIIGIFLSLMIRFLRRSLQDTNFFILLAGCGLSLQFSFQAFVNMASALNIIPTKGMTLPFISYGGSSMLALAICCGMLLSLTRKRHSFEYWGE